MLRVGDDISYQTEPEGSLRSIGWVTDGTAPNTPEDLLLAIMGSMGRTLYYGRDFGTFSESRANDDKDMDQLSKDNLYKKKTAVLC